MEKVKAAQADIEKLKREIDELRKAQQLANAEVSKARSGVDEARYFPFHRVLKHILFLDFIYRLC